MVLRSLLIILLLLSVTVNAKEIKAKAKDNVYVAEVISIYDGDTFTVKIPIWVGLVKTISLRVNGIDTPEMSWRAGCEEEQVMAKQAKALVVAAIKESNYIVKITGIQNGKYAGRALGNVILESGETVSGLLLEAGLAREYHGGSRTGWCPDKE